MYFILNGNKVFNMTKYCFLKSILYTVLWSLVNYIIGARRWKSWYYHRDLIFNFLFFTVIIDLCNRKRMNFSLYIDGHQKCSEGGGLVLRKAHSSISACPSDGVPCTLISREVNVAFHCGASGCFNVTVGCAPFFIVQGLSVILCSLITLLALPCPRVSTDHSVFFSGWSHAEK